jgi:hypothetical protein
MRDFFEELSHGRKLNAPGPVAGKVLKGVRELKGEEEPVSHGAK